MEAGLPRIIEVEMVAANAMAKPAAASERRTIFRTAVVSFVERGQILFGVGRDKRHLALPAHPTLWQHARAEESRTEVPIRLSVGAY